MRREHLVSRHLEVALVYKNMLGLDEAIAYLERENIPRSVAEAYLHGASAPAERPDAKPGVAPVPEPACRRKNRVHDAIVEAALKIERKMGTAWALTLLREENVPEAVALRILAHGPRQVRARPAPATPAA